MNYICAPDLVVSSPRGSAGLGYVEILGANLRHLHTIHGYQVCIIEDRSLVITIILHYHVV